MLDTRLREKLAELESDIEKRTAQEISQIYCSAVRTGKPLLQTAEQVKAYAVCRMPATYAAARFVFSDLMRVCSGQKIGSFLDIGAGTGAGLWAAITVFGDLNWLSVYEPQREMQKLGEKLSTFLPVKVNWLQKPNFPNADVVFAGYVLNEVQNQDTFVQSLWNATKQFLILVEAGTPTGFSYLLKAKQLLTGQGGFVVAPCSGNFACPCADWCHFAVRVNRSKMHKFLKGGTAPYEDEKFSYLIVAKEEIKLDYHRIIRHPQISAGKITLKLCGKEGISKRTITKKDKSDFKTARKSNTGDIWK